MMEQITGFCKRHFRLAIGGVFVGLVLVSAFFTSKSSYEMRSGIVPVSMVNEQILHAFSLEMPVMKYGFVLNHFDVDEGVVDRGETFGLLLSLRGFSDKEIQQILTAGKEVYSISRNFVVGKKYVLLTRKGENRPAYFIYEPNVYEYIVYDLTAPYSVKKEERPVEVREASYAGEITSSLWNAIEACGAGYEAAAKLEDALETSVDFSHIQLGDQFKMIIEEKYIEGEKVGTGNVLAAYYKQSDREHYVFWFDNGGKYKGYYDREGRPMKSRFLKAPVKYTRISSRYNPRRFHPILKRTRPHLGTDYAAPHGTPIYAVGNGVVVEKGYTRGNGNYIKIKHDKTYQTQYLHMSRFAKGIKKGSYVSQGQVIGYVGSTGLATGPHVCFRFWKNGKQVNHLKEYLPPAPPLPEDILPDFFKVRDKYFQLLQHRTESVWGDDEPFVSSP